MQLYTDFWTEMVPIIIKAIENGGCSCKIEKSVLESLGNRTHSGYSFRLDIFDGVIPRKSGSAVARDLKEVLDENQEFKRLAKNERIVIRMNELDDMSYQLQIMVL